MRIYHDIKFKSQMFYGKSSFISILRVLFSDGSLAIVLYRITQFLFKYRLGFVGYFFQLLNKYLNGCVIGGKAEFDTGFVLMHPHGVIINSEVKGGKNIVIESGVVIGAARNGLPVEAPYLKNNIFIGSGAKILGGISIGNHVNIGANAVVLQNVPDNSTAVGVPARIIEKK